MTSAIDLSRYSVEIRERGWSLHALEVHNIASGAERALLERFPDATAEDVAEVAELLRIRACDVRSQHGAWPPKSGKGSWFDREIETMLADPELNPLFATALYKN